jgi:hypothetical protein
MNASRTAAASAALALLAACGPGGERVDETARQQTVTPAAEQPAYGASPPPEGQPATAPVDTTISGQTPTVDRPQLSDDRHDTMGAGAGTSVVPPGRNQ